MKTARWLVGVTVLAGVVLTALLASANSGDAIYIKKLAAVTLTGPQKTAAASWANAEYPAAVLANVDLLYCRQNRAAGAYDGSWFCTMCDQRTVAASGWLDLEDNASAGQLKSFAAGNATYSNCADHPRVGNLGLLQTFVEAWAPAIGTVVDFTVWRPDPATPSRIDAQANVIVTASPSSYLTDLNNGVVARRIGRVP